MKILKPSFLLDKDKFHVNLRSLIDKIDSEVNFRPHFKTHQSLEVGKWFKTHNIESITVSSLSMAQYFSDQWDDIFISTAVNLREIEGINKLASKINLHLCIDSLDAISILDHKINTPINIYIEIDCGYHRTGLELSQKHEIAKILDLISNNKYLHLTGYFTHSGNSYHEKSSEKKKIIFKQAVNQLKKIQQTFADKFPHAIISMGDTPSLSIIKDFNLIDEIRPGNFAFYDVMQYYLNSCPIEDIAVAVLCPVISKNKERGEIVVYGGSVHLSTEYIQKNENKVFGLVCKYEEGEKWALPYPDTFVSSLSQEHGIIRTCPEVFEKIKLGDLLAILPVHSCITANLYDKYYLLNGKKISKFRSL